MKRAPLFMLLMAASISHASDYTVRWLKKPIYDKITIAPGANLFLADSAKTVNLLNFEGQKLAAITDSVCGFNENLAVTVKNNSSDITGILGVDGKFISLADKKVEIAMNDPYFHNGMLLVKSQDGYGFVSADGEMPLSSFPVLYPYHGGVASGMMFEDPKKPKNPYYVIFDKECKQIKFVLPNGKGLVEPKQVNFISSLSDDGKCIVVIKRKLYEFALADGVLTPLFTDTDFERKHQVEVNGEMSKWLQATDNGFILSAAAGKDNPVSFVFNRFFQPMQIRYPNLTKDFKQNPRVELKYESNLSGFRHGESDGLKYNGITICPPQFEKVDICVGDAAVITKKGRQGIVGVTPEQSVNIVMNHGDDIAFRHQKFNTSIRLQLPSQALADKYSLDIDHSKGCIIDPTTRTFNNTENGNWVQYDCTLMIPDSLPPTLTTITYPVTVVNDGLRLADMNINVKAWHYRYHTVDIDESELVIDNGNVLFPVAIQSEKVIGDSDYPIDLSISTSGLDVEIDKISETLYKCKILNLAEGPNSFNVVLREKGCPPIIHPFMVDYTKGKRTRGRTVKEAAAIQRQSILQNATLVGAADPSEVPDQQSNYLEQQMSRQGQSVQPDSVPPMTQPQIEAGNTQNLEKKVPENVNNEIGKNTQPSTLDLLKSYQEKSQQSGGETPSAPATPTDSLKVK